MGNKIGLILGMAIFLQIILLSADIIGLQLALSKSYLMAISVNDYIAKNGVIDSAIQDYVFQSLGVYLVCDDLCYASSGNPINYRFEINFNPIFGFIKEFSPNFLIIQKAYVE